MNMDRFLIVGFGDTGRRIFNIVETIAPQCSLAVWNIGTYNEQIPKKINIITGLEQALKFCPTGVFISTPTSKHIEYAELFLNIAKWIIIDKPLDSDMNKCEVFARNVKHSTTRVYINFQRRYMTCWLRVKKLLNEIHFGEFRYGTIKACLHYPDWRTSASEELCMVREGASEGVFLTGCQELDLINWLIGPITKVSARTTKAELTTEVENNAQLMMEVLLPYGKRNIVLVMDNEHKSSVKSTELVFCDKTIIVQENINRITILDVDGEVLLEETTAMNDPCLELLKDVIAMKENLPSLSEGLWVNAIIYAAKKSVESGNTELITPSICPAEGVEYLNDAIDLLKEAFKARLIAVYGLGSLGYGGYVTGWSDFDIDVIIDSDYEHARMDYQVGKRIESIIKNKGFDRIDIRVYDYRHLNERKTILEYGQCSRATMLCDSAVLLMGKDIRAYLKRPTRREQNLEAYNLLKHMLGFKDDWWNDLPWDDIAAHFALTARFLYTKDTGKVAGKKKALEYALNQYSNSYDTEQLQWLLWALAMRMKYHPLMIQKELHVNAVEVLRRTFEKTKSILAEEIK